MMVSVDDFCLQGSEIKNLFSQIEQNRMTHALLISGEPGTGKRTLSTIIASALLCSADGKRPCGYCRNCQAVYASEHPDLILIEKGKPLSGEVKKGRNTIPVDDIREMIGICSRYPYEGGNRVVIIAEAENMTAQAQNCLLKILEEPQMDNYFILTSVHPDILLPTVRSRCQIVRLKPMDQQYIVRNLIASGVDPARAKQAAAASSGSVGIAQKLAGDEEYWTFRNDVMNAFFQKHERSELLHFSTKWKDRKDLSEQLFGILEEALRSLLRRRLYSSEQVSVDTFPPEWLKFSEEADIDRFSCFFDRLDESRRQLAFNVNFQSVIEQLLLCFMGEREKWQK